MRRTRARLAASFAGFSPETSALILVVGLVLGTFPIYGCPTVLCALASLIFGLNLPAVQLVNQLVTPLQLALLVPFMKLGSRLIPSGHALLGPVLEAVAGWLCVSVPAGVVLYFVLLYLLRRFEGCRLIPAPAR